MANANYGEEGQGNSIAGPFRDLTKGPNPIPDVGQDGSQGEVPGVGSQYAAAIVEYPNTSNNRNQGPSRAPSPIGATPIPFASDGMRNTGRIG